MRLSVCLHDGRLSPEANPAVGLSLGRRVYPGVVVVLVSAMLHGIFEKQAAATRALVAVIVPRLAKARETVHGSLHKGAPMHLSAPARRAMIKILGCRCWHNGPGRIDPTRMWPGASSFLFDGKKRRLSCLACRL